MKRILPLLAAMIALTTVLPGKAQTGKYYIDGRETTREELLKLPAGTIESMANSVENGLPVVRIKLKPEGGEQAPATGQQEKNTATPHEKAMQLVRGIYEQHTLLKEGDLAADFRATKYAGGDLTLTALRGKVVLLNFWATWCGPCKKEMPAMKALEAEYKDNKDIVFMGISVDASKNIQKWKDFVIKEQLPGVQLFAGDMAGPALSKPYKITGIPRFMLVGKDGSLLYMDAPRPSSSEIRAVLNDALKK